MKKVIINENQYNKLLISEELFSTKNISDIIETTVTSIMCGFMTLTMALMCVNDNKNIPDEQKEIVKSEIKKNVIKKSNEDKQIKADTVPLKPIQQPINDNTEWRCISSHGRVTVYNAVKSQCNNDVEHTASGFKLNLRHPERHRIVAMDREFMKYHGIRFGDVIKVENAGDQSGIYQVQDYKNKRYKMEPDVDVLSSYDTKYGGSDGKAKIYVLKSKKNSDKYKKKMLDSL